MAHYAFLDENNIVTEVIVGKDETDTSHTGSSIMDQSGAKFASGPVTTRSVGNIRTAIHSARIMPVLGLFMIQSVMLSSRPSRLTANTP